MNPGQGVCPGQGSPVNGPGLGGRTLLGALRGLPDPGDVSTDGGNETDEPSGEQPVHRAKSGGVFGVFARSTYVLSTSTLMLVRGKVLALSVFTGYDGAADLEWIRLTTARWIDELKRLNPR